MLVKSTVSSVIERLPNFFHQRIIEIEVMHHAEPGCKNLVCPKQMPEVSPAMVLANRTTTLRIKRFAIGFIFLVVQNPDTLPGE